MTQTLTDRTVLITGANGGLGTHFVGQALDRGASRVYAAARTPRSWDDDRVVPLALDIADAGSVAAAVAAAPDVDLLINNAAIAPAGDLVAGSEELLREIFETNFFGTVRVANAFAPVLAANGGGTLLNILSSAAWIPVPTGYAASKAATWSATNALRVLLREQGTHVAGLLVGMIDVPSSARWDMPKVSPESVVAAAYDGLAAGALEILADEGTRQLKQQLSTPGEVLYPEFDKQLAGFVP